MPTKTKPKTAAKPKAASKPKAKPKTEDKLAAQVAPPTPNALEMQDQAVAAAEATIDQLSEKLGEAAVLPHRNFLDSVKHEPVPRQVLAFVRHGSVPK